MRLDQSRRVGRRSDVVDGIQGGAILGVILSVEAGLRATRPSTQLFYHAMGSPWAVACTTFAGALLAGAIIGVLRPLARGLFPMIAIGALAVFPIFLGLDALQGQASFPVHP